MTDAEPTSLWQGKYRLRFETQAWEEWKQLDGAPKQELRELLIKRLDNSTCLAAQCMAN